MKKDKIQHASLLNTTLAGSYADRLLSTRGVLQQTSAICCFFSSLTVSVKELWSLSIMTKLLLWGWMTNFRGVYRSGVATWLNTAPSFSRAKILKKKKMVINPWGYWAICNHYNVTFSFSVRIVVRIEAMTRVRIRIRIKIGATVTVKLG